jgi:hypothetical protein
MMHRQTKKEPGNTTRADVLKEMSKPRMAKSARIAEQNLDASRIPERSAVTIPGTVDKIIPFARPSQPEKAQIIVDEADPRHRNFRIENILTDENGDDVKLKKRARVEVTVTQEPEGTKQDR